MNLKILIAFVFSLFFITGQAVASDVPRVAVLELQGELPANSMALLSDKVRAGVLEATEGRQVVVMSRENMAVLAKDMGLELDCIEGACEVETGRNIGADYVVSGSLSQLGGFWVCTVKFHKTDTGALLATQDARAVDELALLDAVAPMVAGLSKKALGSQFGSTAGGGVVTAVGVSNLYLGDDIDNAFTDETGFLFIKTLPEDAEVLLNGEVIGSGGRVQKEAMVGRYVLAVRHPGPYHGYVSQPFELGSDGHKQTITLKPAFGTLSVQSSPSGADVWIGGKRVGTTPYLDNQYPSGQVQIKVTKGFYASSSRTVTVEDEQTADVNVELSQNFGTLTVTSEPAGAEIMFGKESTGERTPHTFKQLEPGVYAVGLQLYGYLDAFEKIDLKVGDETTHAVAFEKAMGQMVLTAVDLDGRPCDGEVEVDGDSVGTTPYKGMAQVGTHEVKVRCGSDWVEKTLTIVHNDAIREEFAMAESRARNERLAAEKRRRKEAAASARRDVLADIFANADEDAGDLWLYYYSLLGTPTYHRIKFEFKPDDAQQEWLMLPFSGILSNGIDWWIGEAVLIGLDIPMYVQPWGLTKSLVRDVAPFSDIAVTFNPTVKAGFRPFFNEYQRFHFALKYTSHFSFGGEQFLNLGMRMANEEETIVDRLVFNVVEFELFHQPQPILSLSPAVRYIAGTADGRYGPKTTSYEFSDIALGGRVGVPLEFYSGVGAGLEAWYFEGPVGKSNSDLSKYQDYGARLYMKLDLMEME